MNQPFTGIKLDRPKVLHQQIREQVRELIVSGQLKAGEKLPSTQELAVLFQANVCTVHNALIPLVKEGLLRRDPHKGTFVQKRSARLTRVGLCATVMPNGRLDPYVSRLRDEVEKLLRGEKIDTRFFVDDQPEVPGGRPVPSLVEAARRREVQAVIVLSSSWERVKWLYRLPVPLAYQGSADYANNVGMNLGQLAAEALRLLRRQGGRSIGAIVGMRPLDPRAEQKHRAGDDLFAQLVSVAGELGTELRNEWVRIPPDDQLGLRPERFGYEQFQQLWSLPRRPAGLLVFPDSVARGVMTALMERRVRVPQELRLVLSRNRGMEFFVPVPVTFADMDPQKVAAALLEQIQRQLRGESCRPISISFDFRANEAINQQPIQKEGKEGQE